MKISIENNHLILTTKKAAYLWRPWIKPFRWSFKKVEQQLKRFDEIQLAKAEERCSSKHYLEHYNGINEGGEWKRADDFTLPEGLKRKN
jgi:hypothetical protein